MAHVEGQGGGLRAEGGAGGQDGHAQAGFLVSLLFALFRLFSDLLSDKIAASGVRVAAGERQTEHKSNRARTNKTYFRA